MNEEDITQYINGLSSNVGRIADNISRFIGDSVESINKLNGTLTVTNILLAILAIVSIANFILKLKKR